MRIESNNTVGLKSNIKESDQILESIQQQIIKLQEKLKRIDADQKLSLEDKNEQKKLIYDQINNLRQLYSQREIAIIREQQQQNKLKVFNENDSDAVVPDGNLVAMVSADSALNSIKTAKSVRTKLEAQENTLNNEIKTDSGRGLDVSEKVEESNGLSAKIQKVIDFMAEDVKKAHKAFGEAEDEEKDARNKRQKNNNGHVDVLI